MKSEQGMTLVEVLVTTIILAMLASVASLSISFYIREGKTRIVNGDLATLKAAVRLFILDHGSVPADLNALVTGSYIPEQPQDPFKNPAANYLMDSSDASYIYIYSVGPNGVDNSHTGDDIAVTINQP